MSPTIQVYERSVYGRQTIYPACPNGKQVLALTGKKTLSPCDIRTLQGLGFEIEYVADPESQQARMAAAADFFVATTRKKNIKLPNTTLNFLRNIYE